MDDREPPFRKTPDQALAHLGRELAAIWRLPQAVAHLAAWMDKHPAICIFGSRTPGRVGGSPMTRMLVVASPTLTPLNTAEPVPTDGQPTWWRCSRCGTREQTHDGLIGVEHETPSGMEVCEADSMAPDGPFPFTVVVWQEVATCGACGAEFSWPVPSSVLPPVCERHASGRCDPWDDPIGGVVATVEVTGPSHHADECCISVAEALALGEDTQLCDSDAASDCWHTSVGQVTQLDRPIPMERPLGAGADVTVWPVWSAEAWWADLDLENLR